MDNLELMHEIEVWTMPDCPRCAEAKQALADAGLRFAERPLAGLTSGEIYDPDALAELAMNNGAAPLIRVDKRFVSAAEFDAALLLGE